MITVFILIACIANLSLISCQAIPYSYASGRNVTAVEVRFARYREAKARNATSDELFEICGRIPSNAKCDRTYGRPKNHESLACDSLCCLAGSKVGNCGREYGAKLDFAKITIALTGTAITDASEIETLLGGGGLELWDVAHCRCSDDDTDIRCGRDESFLNIKCPFDKNACWRKCCREGKSWGKCKGVLKTKCRCY